jgi:hypothetical protein
MKFTKIIYAVIILIAVTFFILHRMGLFDQRQRVIHNYGKEIEEAAKKYNLNDAFLKALCVLESSGNKPSASRFEKRVYNNLLKVKKKKGFKYGSITHNMIKDASDEALRNLATSWGPFQLMGYQCLEMGIYVKDIRGENSVDWSVKWINKNYGNFVRNQKYADAFHIHNTGKPVPRSGKFYTYNKNYIPSGLQLIEYFSN